MDISIQSIQYICELAKTLHFKKAANACHTAQPNISMQLKKVEEQLGVSIFERTNKSVKLTPKGKEIIVMFQDILKKIDTIKDIANPKIDTLSIGIFPTLAPYFLPIFIPKVRTIFPDIKLKIIEDKTQVITQKLSEGELDCMIAAYPISTQTLEYKILFEDPFYIAMSIQNPLSHYPSLTIQDLKDQSILVLEEGHCLRENALEICHTNLLHIDQTYRAASLETLRAMVASNAGITFMPKIALDNNPLITYKPIKNMSRKIALYYRKSFYDKAKLELIKQIM